MGKRSSSTRGFKKTGSVLSQQIRRAGESRGFAVSRVLTHWPEIAGPKLAGIARPVDITYGRGSLGATLTVLTTGANAPLLEMQKDVLRERVNGVYGYNAIARIRITQTAATGFAEGQVDFSHRQEAEKPRAVISPRARAAAEGVTDSGLRQALELLGANVMDKAAPKNRRTR